MKVLKDLAVSGSISVGQFLQSSINTDKFLVSESGVVKFRSGSQLLGDIGAAASDHTHTFASLTSKPTTLSGYGITDAVNTATTITINGTTYDLSANRSWTITTSETDTLATVTGRGASTSTAIVINNTLAVGHSSHYDSAQFSLDVNGGLLVKNTGKTAHLILINANPAAGGNAGFVQHAVGGTINGAFASIQTYYGASIAAGTLQLQPSGGIVTIGGSTVFHAGNYTTYSPTLTGSGASGTWAINITGSAGSVAWANVTGRPTALSSFTNDLGNYGGWITGYTETDTLASVTARGATTSITSIFTGGLQARKNQSDNNYTTAALWTESYGNTTTGIAFHISGVVGKFLEMRTNGTLYWENGQVWTSGTLTNLNQLTNGPGYLTGITSGQVTGALGFTPYNATNPSSYITQSNALQPIYGDSGAHNLNVSGQHANIRYSQGTWVNPPTPGNYSHVLSFNLASDHRTVQMYLGDVPGYLWWRMAQGPSVGFHPWERIWTSVSLTNLNQLTNGPGYITSYTETDTLATVVGRGNSTGGGRPITLDTGGGAIFVRASTGGWSMGTYYQGSSGTTLAGFGAYGGNNSLTWAWVGPGYESPWLTLNGSAVNSQVALQQGGNQVWHQGNLTNLNQLTNGPGYITAATNVQGLYLQGLGNASMNVNNGATAVYRNENGLGGNLSYAPVLHLGGGDTMWQIQGDYSTSTDLRWRAGYQGTWYTWRQILHSANYNSYSPTLTGTGASGTWGISITGNAATVGGYAPSGPIGANTVVIRDVNNYIYAHYINSNVSETENPTINSFYTSNGDGWLRKSSLAHVRSQLGNYGSWITSSSLSSYLPLSGGTLTGNLYIQSGGNPTQFNLRGTNPELYVDAAYGGGTARLIINRGGTGNQATLHFTTGTTVTNGTAWNNLGAPLWTMGMTNTSQTSDFKLAYGDIYDANAVAFRIDTNRIAYFTNTPYVGANIIATQSWVTSQGYSTSSGSFLPLSGGTVTGDVTFGNNSTSDQGIRINYGNYASGYGRIRFMQDSSNHSTIHSFSASWQSGTLQSASSGAINLDGQNGITIGPWNNPSVWIDNGGVAQARGSFRAPIFYDSEDTAYYLNPAGGSRLRNLYVGDSGDDWSDPGGWGTQVRFSNGPHVKFVLHARTPGIEAGMYVHTPGSVYIGSYTSHDVSLMYGGTRKMGFNASYIYTDVYLEAAGSLRAPIFYDSNDTGYYLDPNGTSNLNKLSGQTMAYNDMNPMSANSPYAARYGGSANYRNGTMGYGQVSFNEIFSNWGSGFIDSWSSPANAPGGSSHYVGHQVAHYNYQNSYNVYGYQMACAGEADNRFFWRSSWNTPRSWVEMIHSGNIGGQKVDGAMKLWAESHPSDYYVRVNWTGTYWRITSNHSSGVQVAYADSAGSAPASGGNSSTVGGYSVSTGGDANTIPTRNASGYLSPQNWIQFNGNYGLYFPNHYGMHFYPNNDGSYGAAQILGEKGGWRGLHFGGGNGMTLMMNEGEFGFHRQAVGWTARFTSGRYYGTSDNTVSISSATGGAYTWTGINYFETNNGGQAVNNSNSAKLQAYSSGNNSAFMSFHKGGYYAVNFGLDDDNVMRIGGWSAGANRWQLDMSGNMTVAGDVTAYSDARVKENVHTVENALDKTLRMRGVTYNRTDSDDKKTKVGVIAQEMLEVLPEVVNQDNAGMYNVSYGNIVGVLVEAIKEQQGQIEGLKKQIEYLVENK
jgi:hypothetical protein